MLKTLSSVFFNCSLVVFSFGFTAPVFAQSTPKSSPPNRYPADFVTDYTNDCIKTNKAEGFDPATTKKLCSCIVTQTEAKIPYKELKSIIAEMEKTQKDSPKLQQIFSSCKNQVTPK